MKLDRIRMTWLLQMYFNGNFNRFARALEVDPAHLYRFLKTGIGGGNKMIGGFIKFCKRKGINYEEYFIFENS